MNTEIIAYNLQQSTEDQEICALLAATINQMLPDAEHKIWHGHPVWFLEGNPIVGYSKQKAGIRLLFWSGADFGEKDLDVLGQKFKDASVIYSNLSQLVVSDIQRWLQKSKEIQWDYKNLVKRKGKLEPVKPGKGQ